MRQRTTTTSTLQRHAAAVRHARAFLDCFPGHEAFDEADADCPDYALGMLADTGSNPFAALTSGD